MILWWTSNPMIRMPQCPAPFYNLHNPMPLFWLRVALTLYGVGLLYAVVTLWGSRKTLTAIMLPAVGLGAVFHFVALVEYAMLDSLISLPLLHQVESLLAFLLMAFFFVVYFRYKDRKSVV